MGIRVKKKAMTLHFKEEKPTVYKLSQVKEQTVKYDQLCRNISANTGIRRGEVEDVLESLAQQAVQMMEMGHTVQIGILGSLKPTIITKSAKTSDELNVSDNIVRLKVRFYPGEIFRNLLADMEIETESDDDDAPASDGGGSTDNSGEQEDGTDFT